MIKIKSSDRKIPIIFDKQRSFAIDPLNNNNGLPSSSSRERDIKIFLVFKLFKNYIDLLENDIQFKISIFNSPNLDTINRITNTDSVPEVLRKKINLIDNPNGRVVARQSIKEIFFNKNLIYNFNKVLINGTQISGESIAQLQDPNQQQNSQTTII